MKREIKRRIHRRMKKKKIMSVQWWWRLGSKTLGSKTMLNHKVLYLY